MCGIAVIVGGHADAGPAIRRMTARLSHRGPDANAVEERPGCALGHTRLAVIDLEGGAQPMADAQGRAWITFNGEVYGYRELRARLEARGVRFRTRSDTEVVLAAYLELGPEALDQLDGQFAFAIWDERTRALFLARDRLGERPLFHAALPGGGLVVASELKAIEASGLVPLDVNPVAVEAFRALLYVPPHLTMYRDVVPLRPGHALSWRDGVTRTWRYWRPTVAAATRALSAEDAAQELDARLATAVRRQMVADVPLGALLSGGLDSSTIVAHMAPHSTGPVKTFSVHFGFDIDERPFARSVAERFATDHHELDASAMPVGDLLERMVDVYDEPFADSSNIPTFLVAQLARREVKVALSGDGADELFGGYSWYERARGDSARWTGRAATAALRALAFACRLALRTGLPAGELRAAAQERRFEASLVRQHPDRLSRHLARSSLLPLAPPRTRARVLAMLQEAFPSTASDPLALVSDFDLQCYLPGDILTKVDRAAAAHGLEVRAPFLDRDLVEFVLALPASIRLAGPPSKALLRASSEQRWPAIVRSRGKQGFGAPVAAWLERADVIALRARLGQAAPVAPQQAWVDLVLGLWLERRGLSLRSISEQLS